MAFKDKLEIFANDLRAGWSILRGDGYLPASNVFQVTIEVTSICNLRCPLCPTGTGKVKRKNRFIPEEIFDRIVNVTRPVTGGYVLSMWGEPALHPGLGALLEKTRPIPTWVASNLNHRESVVRELARWDHLNIMAAVDTLNSSEYTDYRVGGSYDVMLRNLDILSAGRCNVYPQFLVDEGYDPEEYAAFARSHGISSENAVIKIKRENFTLEQTGKPAPGKCHAPFWGLYFDCDGNLVPCCNDVHKDLHMGHINDLDLDAIMHRETIARVRRKLAHDKNQFPSCGQCRGETIWNTRLPVYTDAAKQALSLLTGKAKGPQKMPFREPGE